VRLPLRPELAGFEPYGAPQLDVPICLNVNENPYPLPSAVVADIAQQVAAIASGLNRYPDREFIKLRTALARYLAAEAGIACLPPERLWAGNGSNEIMLHLFQAFGGPDRTALTCAPSYSMYPEYARNTNTAWATVARTPAPDFDLDLDATFEALTTYQPALLVIASPNNPTGTATNNEQIRALAEATRGTGPQGADTVLVVDEAYAEFRRSGTPSALELLDEFEHLVVTRTMSKAFGCAGARIGYLAADARLVDMLRIVRLPYHLSAVTQAVALAALSHADELQAQVSALRAERDALAVALANSGYEVASSDANFLLFGTFADRHEVWQRLLDRGVLIRETGPDGWLRVSVGTPAETRTFLATLREVDPR
jgi:histidinol-phosphate aminotransferase